MVLGGQSQDRVIPSLSNLIIYMVIIGECSVHPPKPVTVPINLSSFLQS